MELSFGFIDFWHGQIKNDILNLCPNCIAEINAEMLILNVCSKNISKFSKLFQKEKLRGLGKSILKIVFSVDSKN